MSSELYLKKLSKLLKISSFFVFQGNSVFWMIEQAELNQSFLQDMASWAKPSFLEGMVSRAKPSFFPKKLEPKLSWAEPSFSSDPTLVKTPQIALCFSIFLKGYAMLCSINALPTHTF